MREREELLGRWHHQAPLGRGIGRQAAKAQLSGPGKMAPLADSGAGGGAKGKLGDEPKRMSLNPVFELGESGHKKRHVDAI